MNNKVFVYGSLKQGHYNNCVFPEGSKLVGEAFTSDGYTMVDLGSFPGVMEWGDGVVKGEVWEVPNFDSLDMLESNGSFYTRFEREVYMDEGVPVKAWIYLLPLIYADEKPVESGEW